jgi:hypothetical protein
MRPGPSPRPFRRTTRRRPRQIRGRPRRPDLKQAAIVGVTQIAQHRLTALRDDLHAARCLPGTKPEGLAAAALPGKVAFNETR